MDDRNMMTETAAEDINELIAVRREKLAALRAEGKDPYQEVRFDVTAHAKDIFDDYAAYEGKTVRMAGRIMSRRIMGKASFAHIQDGTSEIQMYFRIGGVGPEQDDAFKKTDLGDLIGVEGE